MFAPRTGLRPASGAALAAFIVLPAIARADALDRAVPPPRADESAVGVTETAVLAGESIVGAQLDVRGECRAQCGPLVGLRGGEEDPAVGRFVQPVQGGQTVEIGVGGRGGAGLDDEVGDRLDAWLVYTSPSPRNF